MGQDQNKRFIFLPSNIIVISLSSKICIQDEMTAVKILLVFEISDEKSMQNKNLRNEKKKRKFSTKGLFWIFIFVKKNL